jgi:4-hydroxybenzoate polyprenyl transferase
MKKIKLFIELTRLNKPIGFMLLFWPCLWGLTLVYNFNNEIFLYVKYTILFFLGAVLMRSAGCVVNDISDKNFDKKVKRTKKRPLASGKISTQIALLITSILCFLAFLILINFNYLTIILAVASMPFAFSYPLMKRITYWPQLFLGITFNYGLILGWTSINESLDISPIIYYIGAIFWTLGYDTIYGYQDIKDDEIIGVKSTSIKFKKNQNIFLIICYSILMLCLILLGFTMKFSFLYFLSLLVPFYHLFIYQIKNLNTKLPKSCLETFKKNNAFGFIVFSSILIGKFF